MFNDKTSVIIILISSWCVWVGRGENRAALILKRSFPPRQSKSYQSAPPPASHSPIIFQLRRNQQPREVQVSKQRLHSSAKRARKSCASPAGHVSLRMHKGIGFHNQDEINQLVDVSAEIMWAVASLTPSCLQTTFFNSGKLFDFFYPLKPN